MRCGMFALYPKEGSVSVSLTRPFNPLVVGRPSGRQRNFRFRVNNPWLTKLGTTSPVLEDAAGRARAAAAADTARRRAQLRPAASGRYARERVGLVGDFTRAELLIRGGDPVSIGLTIEQTLTALMEAAETPMTRNGRLKAGVRGFPGGRPGRLEQAFPNLPGPCS
jgi:hypothetical protein